MNNLENPVTSLPKNKHTCSFCNVILNEGNKQRHKNSSSHYHNVRKFYDTLYLLTKVKKIPDDIIMYILTNYVIYDKDNEINVIHKDNQIPPDTP